MNAPIITVIVVAYQGDRWLPDCLATLRGAAETGMRLLLVDNAFNTCIGDLDLSGFDSTVLRCESPLGFADANNFALARGAMGTDYVCFLNQDTKSTQGWIEGCVAFMKGDPSVGALTPLITTYDDDGWDPSFLTCARNDDGLRTSLEAGTLTSEGFREVPHVPAAAMLARTDVLREVGPFDPIFGSYYEDYDLCARIRAAKKRVGIFCGARIAHFSGSATDTPQRERNRMRLIIRNRMIHEIRHSGRPRWQTFLHAWLCQFPRNIVRGLVGTPSSQPPGVTLSAWRDLMTMAPRLLSASRDRKQFVDVLDRQGLALRAPGT